MTNYCTPEKHHITLPYGAVGAFGELPNEVIFADRHTYSLSTPDIEGGVEWLVINGRRGCGPISFQSNEALLREQGVFQHGVDTVILKAPTREITISAKIVAPTRLDYLNARLWLGYLLSWDLATSVVPDAPSELPGAFDRPEPWTWTFTDSSDRRFHFDFAAGWVSAGDDDFESQDAFSSNIEIVLAGDDPAFYGDSVEVPVSGRSLTATSSDPANFVTEAFRYEGTARGYMRASLIMNSVDSDTQIYAIGLADVTDSANVRYRRFQYVDYPTSGWTPAYAGDTPFIWDVYQQQFTLGSQSLHLSASPEQTETWNAFQLVPGRSYRLFVESSREIAVTGSVSYKPRYAAI